MNARISADPRHYQIAVLGLIAVTGFVGPGIGLRADHALVALAVTQFAQYAASRLGGQTYDPKSAVITALSLTLLMRSNALALVALAAAMAIASKFLLRIRNKHVFNPANAAIVPLMLASDGVWVATGQWGSATILALALCGLGSLVLNRARRAETTIAFLATYAGLVIGRALWLGDPLSIAAHQLQNGALLVFAFFMISDPKSTPDSRRGRLLFGTVVAFVAFVIQFTLYLPQAALYALFFCAPLTALIDSLSHGPRYRWHSAGNRPAVNNSP